MFGLVLCKVDTFISHLAIAASVNTMLVIAIERYISLSSSEQFLFLSKNSKSGRQLVSHTNLNLVKKNLSAVVIDLDELEKLQIH